MMSLPTPPEAQVHHVACKIPDFWEHDPTTWFAQCEGQFRISKVTSDSLKFDYAVQKLNSAVIKRVRDLVLNPPADGKYDALKARILAASKRSQYEELRDLHATAPLGDRRPSELMDDILASVPSLDISGTAEPFIEFVFLSRLPDALRSLVSVAKYDTLRNLAEHSDHLWTASGGSTAHSLSSSTFVNAVASNVDVPYPEPNLTAVATDNRRRPEPHRHACKLHRRWLHDANRCLKYCDSCRAKCAWPSGNATAGGRRN